jgi:hypothetical protein
MFYIEVVDMLKNKLNQISLMACLLAVSGCVGSTTYGTGKTQNQHLLDDLATIVKPRASNAGKIQYSDRPELIKPADVSQLPTPVDAAAVDDSNWVEEPEIRRAKIRAEAEAGNSDRGIVSAAELTRAKRGAKLSRPPTRSAPGRQSALVPVEELRRNSAEYRKKQAEINGVDFSNPQPRKYLTEPKEEYRTPAATAPVGELGLDEKTKTERLKGERSFFDWFRRN